MPELEIPFHLYDTPEPPAQLSDKIEARIAHEQRLAIRKEAERRQSWKLPVAIAASAALAVAVVVLAVVGRGEGDGPAELAEAAPPEQAPAQNFSTLGAPPSAPVADVAFADYRPLAARKLVNPGLLRQFPTVAARNKLARAIAEARSARLAAKASSPAQTEQAGGLAFGADEIKKLLDRAELARCYAVNDSLAPDYGLVLAMMVAGEPGHGRLVEQVTISATGGAKPNPELVECVTQTVLSIRFPPPQVGSQTLMAYPLPAPAASADELSDDSEAEAPPKPAPIDVRNATVDKAREAAKAGHFAEALALAEAVLKRKPADQDGIMVAIIAACNTTQPAVAKKYLPRLSSAGRRSMGEQICEKQLGYSLDSWNPSTGVCIDEVACLIADKPPACCKQYGKPSQLDRAAIKAGIANVRDKIAACGKLHPGKGTLKIVIDVAPAGEVRKASVKQAPNHKLGQCAADEVLKARFKATREGSSFTYPFIFR